MLRVKKLHPDAKLPSVAHPGEDLGYDVYALRNTMLHAGITTAVDTGIAVNFDTDAVSAFKFGLIVKDRSSMAAKGIRTSAGVIDAGYTGELRIMLTSPVEYAIKAGDKIAQVIPQEVFTGLGVSETEELKETSRGDKGFGSTGF